MAKTLKSVLFASAMAVAAVASTAASALDKVGNFPSRPITIIVPYGAGGGSDQLSRAFGVAFDPITGVGSTVVNKDGGGGLAAIPDFMTAPKDGYTILQHIDDAVTAYVSGKLRENPAKDWVPVCMMQITFSQLYVRPDDSRFPDIQAVIKYAKDNPGKLTVANVGNLASMERVNTMKVEEALGIETNQISFDKPTERYAALIGGQVDAMFEQPGDVKNFLDAGQMKPVLTYYSERPKGFENVPTTKDIGVEFEPLLRYRGFFVHPGIGDKKIAYFEEGCKQAYESESFQKFNQAKFMDLIPSYRDREGSVKLIEDSIKTYEEVFSKLGLVKK